MHGIKKEVTFGKRADKYDAGVEGRFLKKFYDFMERFVSVKSGDRFLDVACGTGAVLGRFNHKKVEAYGIDIDSRMIQIAREKFPEMNFSVCSCDTMPFDDEFFDKITVNMAYHHFDNKEGFAKECLRTLKKDGNLYISELRLPVFLRKIINLIMKHHNVVGKFYSLNELKRDFESLGFTFNESIKSGKVQIIKLKKCGKK